LQDSLHLVSDFFNHNDVTMMLPRETLGMGIPTSDKSISPVVVTIFLTSFVAATHAFGVYLFSALVPEVRSDLGIGQDTIGLASGAAQAGNMLFAVLAGFLVPRIAPIRAIYLFLVVTVLCQGMLFAVSDVGLMMAILFVTGGTGAVVWVAIVVATQTLIPDSRRAVALGLMSSGTSFGLFLNGLIVPYILENWGWRAVWLVLGGVTVALVMVSLRFLHPILNLSGQSESAENRPKSYWRSFRQPAAVFSVLLLFGTALSLVPYQTYLTSLLRDNSSWTAVDASRAWGAIGTGGMSAAFCSAWSRAGFRFAGRSF
jgi:predicted MFS family arabinose efflux permease